MISDWTKADGLKAIEQMGWPEWTESWLQGHWQCRLFWDGERLVKQKMWDKWQVSSDSVDGTALALLRDKAIAFLVDRGCSITIRPSFDIEILGASRQPIIGYYDDPQLIAAVLEVSL